MKTIKLLSIGIFLATSTFSLAGTHLAKSTTLQPGTWEKLGSRIVDMTADHDEIIVTAHDGVFTSIRLGISKAPIHLNNINVVFGNGENENIKFDKDFAAGSYTRNIDFPGNRRIIKKVNLNYRSVPDGKGRSVVTLFGKH